MSHSASAPDVRILGEALLAFAQGTPSQGAVVARLGSLERAIGPDRFRDALRAADLSPEDAASVGVRAASSGEVALAARLAGVGSMERALRQADRLLPREHPDGLFTVRALAEGEATIVYRVPTPVDPLSCAVRGGLLAGLPRCFGAPLARVDEVECVSTGADACCFRVRWSEEEAGRSRGSVLGLGALAGTGLALAIWALASWSLWGSALGCGLLGLGSVAWLARDRRPKVRDYRDDLVATLEQRIAERMDDLAKLDSRLELRRMVAGPPASVATMRRQPIDLGNLQREAAAFGRRLETACFEAGERTETAVSEDLEALAGHYAGLRDRIDGLVEASGVDGLADGAEDLGSLLQCVVQRARRSRGGSPEIVVEVAPGLPRVRCSATRIERALLSLLEHACENAGEAGRVEAYVSASAGGVEVTVCGRGVGLDPTSVEEVFDPFLGDGTDSAPGAEALRTAACIVTEHGGSLQLRPDAERGAHASFVLPAAEGD